MLVLAQAITPSASEILSVFQQHINQLAALEASEKIALLQARRLLKWYFPRLNNQQLAYCYKIDDLTCLYQAISRAVQDDEKS